MALDIQLSMFIQSLSELSLVYHKEQMFVKAFAYLFENRAILFSLPQKKLTGYEYGQLFSAVLLFAAVSELFAVVDELSAVAGGEDHFLSEAGDAYSAIRAVDKFQAVYIRIVQAQGERIDEKSDLTLLSEQDGVCKHTEMDESGQRLALRPVFVNIGNLLNQRILFVEIYSCADFL